MWQTIMYSLIAGVAGTLAGAIVPLFVKTTSDKAISLLLSFSAGFMLAIVAFDLIPEGAQYSNALVVVCGVMAGIGLIALVNRLISRPLTKTVRENGGAPYYKLGIIMLFAIGLHNLPEGMAIGALETDDNGLAMTILIALHNIPEGIAMAAPLARAKLHPVKVVGLCMLSGLPTVLGAVIGYGVSGLAVWIIGLCLALAAGAMVYLIFQDMLVEAYSLNKSSSVSMTIIFGLLLGYTLITIL